MPTIKNMSYGPLSIARADKESLTLGPRETARITDEEFDSDDVRRHLRERQLAVLPGAPWKKPRGGKGGSRSHSDEGRGSAPSTPTPTE